MYFIIYTQIVSLLKCTLTMIENDACDDDAENNDKDDDDDDDCNECENMFSQGDTLILLRQTDESSPVMSICLDWIISKTMMMMMMMMNVVTRCHFCKVKLMSNTVMSSDRALFNLDYSPTDD